MTWSGERQLIEPAPAPRNRWTAGVSQPTRICSALSALLVLMSVSAGALVAAEKAPPAGEERDPHLDDLVVERVTGGVDRYFENSLVLVVPQNSQGKVLLGRTADLFADSEKFLRDTPW